MELTAKQRLLRALRGQEIDRTPWSPFLAYWWEHQPEAVTRQGQLNFMESVGADPLLRGFSMPWRVQYHGVDSHRTQTAGEMHEEWTTPVGKLHFGNRLSPNGNTWFLVEHPVKTVEDLKTLQWIYEHSTVEHSPAADEAWAETGERGLYLPLIGSELKTCFQAMVERWVGTEMLVYLLADEPEAVEECLAAMRRISDQTAAYCAASRAEGFIFWEDSSTTNINPAMFNAYAAPEIRFWADTLHAADKLLVHHACGHLKALLPHMAAAGVDVIESISPPPTGNIDIADAFALLPQHVALIGGIEPVFFQNCTAEELDARTDALLQMTAGRRYVLANSDSCPPAVEEWKFRRVTDRVCSTR
jgi:hypothetical protein